MIDRLYAVAVSGPFAIYKRGAQGRNALDNHSFELLDGRTQLRQLRQPRLDVRDRRLPDADPGNRGSSASTAPG
jgi:hypothetical protein